MYVLLHKALGIKKFLMPINMFKNLKTLRLNKYFKITLGLFYIRLTSYKCVRNSVVKEQLKKYIEC